MRCVAYIAVLGNTTKDDEREWDDVFRVANATIASKLIHSLDEGHILELANAPYPLKIVDIEATEYVDEGIEEFTFICEYVWKVPASDKYLPIVYYS